MSSRSPHRPNASVISSAKHSHSDVDRRRTPAAVLSEIRRAALYAKHATFGKMPRRRCLARGKMRIHKKPRDSEIEACRPWLDAELEVVEPKILVCPGASVAQSLLGKDFRVIRLRGQVVDSHLAPPVVVTVHPSSIFACSRRGIARGTAKGLCSDLKFVTKLAKAIKRSRTRLIAISTSQHLVFGVRSAEPLQRAQWLRLFSGDPQESVTFQ